MTVAAGAGAGAVDVDPADPECANSAPVSETSVVRCLVPSAPHPLAFLAPHPCLHPLVRSPRVGHYRAATTTRSIQVDTWSSAFSRGSCSYRSQLPYYLDRTLRDQYHRCPRQPRNRNQQLHLEHKFVFKLLIFGF